MEESMKSLSKSVELLNVQANSQQQRSGEMKKLLTDLLTEIVLLRSNTISNTDRGVKWK